jgi:putative ABC transport system permease protein
VGDAIPFFGTNFTVVGTMELTGMDFFDRSAFMSMEAAYRMSENSPTRSPLPITIGRDRISTVLVQIKDDMTPERVAIRIEHDIPGIKAISSDTVISTVRKQLSGLMHVILFISVILWIIVLLIMAFAFTMIVNERRRELGILRAMGATKSHITTLILAEASTLSAAGGAAGIVLGVALLLSIKSTLLHYLKLPYLFPSSPELLLLVVGALLIAVLTGLLSALLPAVSAFGQEPYEAIRSSE